MPPHRRKFERVAGRTLFGDDFFFRRIIRVQPNSHHNDLPAYILYKRRGRCDFAWAARAINIAKGFVHWPRTHLPLAPAKY